jgi:nucleoside 2-deoxyribosyltransferase
MDVYFAGKIAKNDWRHVLFPSLREHHDTDKDPLERDGFHYAGPYFISCDHGCYHGNASHGRGLSQDTCEGKFDRRKEVLHKCLEEIEKSQIVFVWINTDHAYGTLAEIGYAKAKNKKIVIAIDSRLKGMIYDQEIWFIKEMADTLFYEKTIERAWHSFVNTYGEVNSKKKTESVSAEEIWLKRRVSEFTNDLAKDHSVEELNDLDRNWLAVVCMEAYGVKEKFPNQAENEAFIENLTKEIDYKIVRGYLKIQKNKSTSELKTWRIVGTGLRYHYPENIEREKENEKIPVFSPSATEKQIVYINSMARKLKKKLKTPVTMGMKEAGSVIQGLQKKIIIQKYHHYFEEV